VKNLCTLQSILEGLPAFGNCHAVGLRGAFGTRWWTFDQLHRNSLYMAHLLCESGLQPADRVVLYAPNSPEWIACLLAAAWRGLVLVPVDATLTPIEVQRLAEQQQARLILVTKPQSIGAVDYRHMRLTSLDAPSHLSLEASALRVPILPNDPAVVLFTAGTSGPPHEVVLTHNNLASQLRRFSFWRPLIRLVPTRLLALSPLSHSQGLLLSACLPLALGLTTLYTSSIEPHHLRRTIRAGRVRILSAVPRILQLLEDSLRADYNNAPSNQMRRRVLGWRMRVLLTGGATLPAARETFWRRCHCLLIQGYGSTETTGISTVNGPILGRRNSIGYAIHRDSLQIAEDGELLIRGPHISPGCSETSQPLTSDGFFPTGDLVRRDRFHRLFFVGRKSERVVTAEGHNIDPNFIETALRKDPAVRDAVVFAAASDGLEHLHASLLLVKPSTLNAAQAIERTNLRLLPWERIHNWSVWQGEDFPRITLHKVQRAVVIASINSFRGATPPTNEPASLDEILRDNDSRSRIARLARHFKTEIPKATLSDLRQQVCSLPIDSVEQAELITLLLSTNALKPEGPSAVAADEPPRSAAAHHAPRWQVAVLGSLLRNIIGSLFRRVVLPIFLRGRVTGLENIRGLHGPLFFVLRRSDRQHPVEFLAIVRALPPIFARRVMVAVSDRPFFESHFYRRPGDSWPYRLFVGWVARFGLPSVLPYVLLEACMSNGLEDICFWVDRGFHPLVTWSQAMARLATETQATVVPIRLRGRWSSWWNAGVQVHFGAPHTILPFADHGYTDLEVQMALRHAAPEVAEK
jgi:long-chain acyl-CoA synthetase